MVGKIGAAAEWLDDLLIVVITWVIERNRAENIRDEIIKIFYVLVDEITSPDKPTSNAWSAWQASVTNVAIQREQRFNRGETVVSLLLAFITVPLAFLPLTDTFSYILTITIVILAFILAVSITVRVAVIDILAFRDPSTKNRNCLKNMWAWNYYILGNSAVMLILLGIAALGNIGQEVHDMFVNKLQELPELKARGEYNRREFQREFVTEVITIYFGSSFGDKNEE